jgi:uncharacterized membrane protein
MKYTDIAQLHEAGLISEEQRRNILEHYRLKEEGGKLLAIFSMIGAVLMTAGISLLIAAHWNEIPRGVKIASGLILMLGAHGVGWWLREVNGNYRKTGEALHVVGSCLFLANIALLGQIYNLVSRPPNALLAWWIGIGALPWLLRSKAQQILWLLAFFAWFIFEAQQPDSLLYCQSEKQTLLYSALGLVYLGFGWLLRRTSFAEFAAPTEKLGLLAFLLFAFPLTWKDFFGANLLHGAHSSVFPVLALAALLAIIVGAQNLRGLSRQWRWLWIGALGGMLVFMGTVWFGVWSLATFRGSVNYYWQDSWTYVPGAIALFVFCLLQIQVGIQERSPFLVNLAVVFIALDMIAAYFDLFGTMARTGLIFVIGGAFLIGFGVYLEKQRRAFMRRIKVQI